jgi:hypothetical protein
MLAATVDAYVGRDRRRLCWPGRACTSRIDACVGRARRRLRWPRPSTPTLAATVDAYVAAPALARRVPGSAPRLAGCARPHGAFAAAGVRGAVR